MALFASGLRSVSGLLRTAGLTPPVLAELDLSDCMLGTQQAAHLVQVRQAVASCQHTLNPYRYCR